MFLPTTGSMIFLVPLVFILGGYFYLDMDLDFDWFFSNGYFKSLSIPGHDHPVEITVFGDVSLNPGPLLADYRADLQTNSGRVTVPLKLPVPTSSQLMTKIILLNARSIRNKSRSIHDYVIDHEFGILFITETWLRGDNSDDYFVRDVCPTGYVFHHVPRTSTTGGGVSVMLKDDY